MALGKLISSQMLRKKCLCDYSLSYSALCKMFAPFMAAFKEHLLPSDRGDDTLKTTPRCLFDSTTSNPEDLDQLVNAKGVY